MEKNIEKKVIATIQEMENKLGMKETFLKFKKASDSFDELMEKGLIQKRGNNLLSASDSTQKVRVMFNATNCH